ncbi:MAG TPA: DUF3006 family protein [Methanocorpusculum sp.]|nr:DUF3006 family protein [Methanocorpusculum sp.]HJJ39749.1 DUF3006 family protein [Methanocorpusculum sp.]HJJ49358.1 DUF3006 family protein [Methanocorpusculum sp.]HJJ56598.1 DUF3006 family protein [Methanocorpusculum sp.]
MKHLVTVDSIDELSAALLLRTKDGEIPLGIFPLSILPIGVRSGDILSLTLEKDETETKAAEERIRILQELLKKKN